jgi:transcriptional regulator with XRE-family HTH domain
MYGDLVAQARRARGLTQVELAAISGIEQANISAIENGHRVPGAATLHRLLHACGFELIAAAGGRVLACPPPEADPFFDALLTRTPGDEPPVVGRHAPMAVRSRVLTAVLDAAEAVVRSR